MKMYHFNGMPLETQIQLRKARELAKRGNDRDALAVFRQAAYFAPDASVAFREVADCLSRLGRAEEAEHYYHRFRASLVRSGNIRFAGRSALRS